MKLSPDYKTTVGETQPLKFSGDPLMNTEGGIFKQNGKYYIVNAGMREYASADSLDGIWTRHDLKMWDGSVKKDISSHNQTSNAFRIRTGDSDLWVCVGDSVSDPELNKEPRYIWLPIQFFDDGTIALWELSNWKIGDIEGVQPEEPGEPGNYDNIPGLSGRVLYDTDGKKIYACGGEVLEIVEKGQKKWYWFGVDDLNRETMNEHPGIHLYSSTDLYNWDYEGVMLNEDGITYAHPKILYNGEEYVMWVSYNMWSESEGGMPPTMSSGIKVLTSESINGPFTAVPDSSVGNDNGFINLYEESKGNGWLIYTDYSAASGSRIFRARLKEDYTGIEGEPQPFQFSSGELSNAEGGIFERNGKYYMVNSGMKEYAVADSFDGVWKKDTLTMWDGTDYKDIPMPNQTSHVFHVKTQEADTYVCMGDSVGGDSPSAPVCYIWLPIEFFDDGTIALKEERDWKIAGMESQKPEPTQKPEATEAPEETMAPEQTQKPEATEAPEETMAPEQTQKPEATKTPEQTAKPEATKTPEQTAKPETTKTPEQTAKPEVTKTPEQTAKPEATKTPEQTAKPEATKTPEQTAKPETTKTPEQTAKPDTTNKPAETGKPEETKRPIEVKSVLVASNKLTLGLGEKVQLEAAAYPRNASDRKLTYKASNSNVSVSKNGKITGKKRGTCKITVSTSNGKKAVVKVSVKKKPKKITLNARNKTLKIGKKFKIKARLPKGTASRTLTYVSNKRAIADVSPEGKVIAKKSGSAVITVKTYNGKKASLKIQVK